MPELSIAFKRSPRLPSSPRSPPRKRNNREESNFRLAPGDTFTFFSDGVVEAQSPTGELFGFERTGSISRQSAEEIADVAQAFGQEDDITVLTLQFAPA
jgi:serine phosphatase RsbU (regulator of sigma subunit)